MKQIVIKLSITKMVMSKSIIYKLLLSNDLDNKTERSQIIYKA